MAKTLFVRHGLTRHFQTFFNTAQTNGLRVETYRACLSEKLRRETGAACVLATISSLPRSHLFIHSTQQQIQIIIGDGIEIEF